jgi:hypothetical protein
VSRVAELLAGLYTLLLRAYPFEFRETFRDEMHMIFLEGAKEATNQRRLGSFMLRELRDTPQSIVKAHWYGWTKKWQKGMQILNEATSSSDLPPPPPDGRESWRQAALEWSLFLFTGLLLVLVTYLPFEGLSAGWQRDAEFLRRVITTLTLPIFLLGMARGLPRWAYPFGGLLLGYQVFTANQSGLWPFLIAILLASAILAVMAIITNPQPSPLPAPLRRIGQSLSLDWTRLSFGIYGAMPLAILMAFDDGHTNSRTPYLALSALGMVASALIYARSRQSTTQIAALVGGMTFSIWAALLDRAAFAGGLGNWIAAPYPGAAEIAWMLQWWVAWLLFILSPALLPTVNRALQSKRAI